MFMKTIPNLRPGVKAAVLGLALGLAVAARAAADESFEAKLRQAAQDQSRKNQAEEEEQKRLAAAFAAKRETMQKQEEAELGQSQLAFKQKVELLRQEQAARSRELEAKAEGQAEQLARSVADLKAQLLVKEDQSQMDFHESQKEFSQKLEAKVDAELAKAEARRERNKQMAITIAMTYFTGGAALPALAAVDAGGSAVTAAQIAPAVAGKTTDDHRHPASDRASPAVARKAPDAKSSVSPDRGDVAKGPSVWGCMRDVGIGTFGGALSNPGALGVGAARGALLGAISSPECRGLVYEAFKFVIDSPGDQSRRGKGWRQEDRLYYDR
jgi:hypothetical protein